MKSRHSRGRGLRETVGAVALALCAVLAVGGGADLPGAAFAQASEAAQSQESELVQPQVNELQSDEVTFEAIPMDQIPVGSDGTGDGDQSPLTSVPSDSGGETLGEESAMQGGASSADDGTSVQDATAPTPTAAGDPPGQPTWTFPDIPRTNVPNYGPISTVGTDSWGNPGWDREVVVITGMKWVADKIVPTTTRVEAGKLTQDWITDNNVLIWAYPYTSPAPYRYKTKLISPSPAGFPENLCLTVGNSTDDQGADAAYMTSCDEAKDWQLLGEPDRCRPGGPTGEKCYQWFLATQVGTGSKTELCGLHLETTGFGMIPANTTLNSGTGAAVICQNQGAGYYGTWGPLTPLGMGHDKPVPEVEPLVQKLVKVDEGGYASTVVAQPASTLTYLLRFTNSGSTPVDIKYVDDLRDVLLLGDLVSVSSGDLSHSMSANNLMTITGTLPAGDTALLTYQVNVKDTAQADDTLTNKVYKDSAESLPPTPATCDTSAGNCTVTTIKTKPTLTVVQRVIPADQQVASGAGFEDLLDISQPAAGWEFTVDTMLGLVLDGTPATQETAGPGPSFGTALFGFKNAGFAKITQTMQSGFHAVPVYGVDASTGRFKDYPAQCVDARTGAGTTVTVVNDNGVDKMRPRIDAGTLVECTYFVQEDPAADLVTVKRIEGVERDGNAVGNVSSSTRLTGGDKVTYNISVDNAGQIPGTTTLTETVPQGSSYAGDPSEGWTYDPVKKEYVQDVTVDAGSSKTVAFTVLLDNPLGEEQKSVTNTVITSVGTCTPCTVTNPIGGDTFQVHKIAENEEGTWAGMPGTEWKLWSSQTGGTEVAAVKQYLDDQGDPVDGLFTVGYLPAGTYWLEETIAPEGFELLAERVEVEVDADQKIRLGPGGRTSNIKVLEGEDSPGAEGLQTIEIKDVPKLELPNTGGVYNWVLGTALGLGILAGAGISVVRRYTRTSAS